MDLHLVDQSRPQVLLGGIGAAAERYVPPICVRGVRGCSNEQPVRRAAEKIPTQPDAGTRLRRLEGRAPPAPAEMPSRPLRVRPPAVSRRGAMDPEYQNVCSLEWWGG